LSYVRSLLPEDASVVLVGDNEFGAVELLQQLEQWGWSYVLRQKSTAQVCVSMQSKWQPFAELAPAREQLFWHPQAILTVKHLYSTHLLTFWERGEDDPWLLATNLPTGREALRAYRWRMWLDEFFGDLKGHGVDLEKTRLRHFQRLSRLVFIVAMLYLWLVTRGAQTVKNGDRYLVDRRDRRDLSIARIGQDYIDWRLARGSPLSIRLIPYF
jgi:hypothetical protein